MEFQQTPGYKILQKWLRSRKWKPAPFQLETMDAFLSGKSGLLNAPTGSGKTYALWFPVLVNYINTTKEFKTKPPKGLQILWITPLRALAKDLQRNMQQACDAMEIPWQVGIRTGDSNTKDKASQKKQMPQALIITPESLHILFSQKNSSEIFNSLHTIVIDEWHELIGSKRGVQTELALSRLRTINPGLRTWGISATIGNLEQAKTILLGNEQNKNSITIIAKSTKKIVVETLLPEKIESLPWSGYLGIRLLKEVVDIVKKSRSTLLFTNTRWQSETWYQAIIEHYPEFAGIAALHHGSLDKDLRAWVEESLHNEKLKLVVCTSSLDLGVDFRPVETVIQIGSPKSISRFVQRAGRSGHQPGAVSKIYFTPTNSLELIEAVSFRKGIENNILEDREPFINAYDVLAQWMVTLAVGEGFDEKSLFEEVKNTNSFKMIIRKDWEWMLGYITTGSSSLIAYDEFKKVEIENGRFVVKDRKIAMRHRLSMGTIVSDSALTVKFQHGKYLGSIEESFVSRLKPGDVFWFAGMSVEFIRIREMAVTVRKAPPGKKGVIPQWMGGRMSLSSNLSQFIRDRLSESIDHPGKEIEIKKLQPLLQLQSSRSAVPRSDELLIEQFEARDGHHIFIFPFEGRLVHEGMSALLAYRLTQLFPITFSIAMNDYGFELLSDQYVNIREIVKTSNIFTTDNLLNDIHASVNATEMAKRKFREIASIAGLIFQGFPGRQVKARQLQASSSLLFDVIFEYEKDNLFVRQAFQEVLYYQLEEVRLRKALTRINSQKLLIKEIDKPSPLSFPILVDRLREQLTSEKLNVRIQKMLIDYSDAD